MKRAMVFGQLHATKLLQNWVFLVVLFAFFAWSLRVTFVSFDALSDLTLAGVSNEGLRAVIFIGPVLIYLRYVERAPALEFLRLNKPSRSVAWVLPLIGTLFVVWYLLLDSVIGDGRINGVASAVVLFAVLSSATLDEEVYFRGFLLNKFCQAIGCWRSNLASSSLFALIHFSGWFTLGNFSSPLVVADTLGILAFRMVFGWVMKKTGSLWPAYVLHTL